MNRSAEVMAEHLDMGRLWEIARSAQPLPAQGNEAAHKCVSTRARIAVASDEAFCFYYADNLDLLRDAGAELVTFSPLRDAELPRDVQGLYLGGGYPELYAVQLARNLPLLHAIRARHAAGMPIYAKCGGLMALLEHLIDLQGQTHTLASLIPGTARMQAHLTMGYRYVTAQCDTPLLRAGEQTRGHEFHYSDWDRAGAPPADAAYLITSRMGEVPRPEGFARGNLLASYVHLHFAAHPEMATRFVAACAQYG